MESGLKGGSILERDPEVEIEPVDDASFRARLALYANRPDKESSFIDCTSIAVMEKLSLADVLANFRGCSCLSADVSLSCKGKSVPDSLGFSLACGETP